MASEDAVETAKEAWEAFGAGAADYTPPDQVVDWDDEDQQRE